MKWGCKKGGGYNKATLIKAATYDAIDFPNLLDEKVIFYLLHYIVPNYIIKVHVAEKL